MRRLSVVPGVLALLLLTGGPALAEEPFRVPDQVTDEAGVLVGNTAAVEDAVEELQADEGIQLWVVYVDTFDGIVRPTGPPRPSSCPASGTTTCSSSSPWRTASTGICRRTSSR